MRSTTTAAAPAVTTRPRRITAPTYRVGRYVLNEYEVRALMLAVAVGEQPAGLVVRARCGRTATIRPDGKLSESLPGFDIGGELSMDLYRFHKKQERAAVQAAAVQAARAGQASEAGR